MPSQRATQTALERDPGRGRGMDTQQDPAEEMGFVGGYLELGKIHVGVE